MNGVVERKVAELEAIFEVDQLERAAQYRVSDAIREGCGVSTQANGWTDGEDALCAMSAAVVAAKARKYM